MHFLQRLKVFLLELNFNEKSERDSLVEKDLSCKSSKEMECLLSMLEVRYIRKNYKPGKRFRVDTGCLVAMTGDVHYDIQFVGGVKTALFGGEGLFFATLRGPGTVWVQSLPFSRLASRVFAAAPERGGSKGEGSIAGGLFDLLGGDRK